MCGIAGAVGEQVEVAVRRMVRAIAHRGPDGEGLHCGSGLAIGMRRLSIIDLERGDQPIYNEAGDKCVVFNGEIYNYRELRAELQSRGHAFTTRSDTEVIIHLYEEMGERCVERLRGMFAFAIADGHRLLLARDRLGIKPLYYSLAADGRRLLFASEIKALLASGELSAAVNEEAVADRLVLGYVAGARTYLRQVESLRPGHTLMVEAGEAGGRLDLSPRRYYALRVEPEEDITLEEAIGGVERALADSVRSHLVADVEVGLTLSGGLDSSLLGVLMKEAVGGRPFPTFTIACNNDYPDLLQSSKLAAQLGTRHKEVVMSYEEYLDEVVRCAWAEEQPPSLYGLPLARLCQVMSGHLKVCLNGEGADILFGGNSEYFSRGGTIESVHQGLARAREAGLRPSYEAEAIAEKLDATRSFDEYLCTFFDLQLGDQLANYGFPLLDKLSMASGVEVRVPFVDDRLVEFANRLPIAFKVLKKENIGKYVLRRVALRRGEEVLVNAVLRHKLDFPSAGFYHLTRFDQMVEAALPEDYLRRHPLGRCFASKRELLMYELFEEVMVRGGGAPPDGLRIEDFIRQRAGRASLSFASS